MPGGTGALVRDTAAALSQRSVCLVVIGDCKYDDSTCSRYSADSMHNCCKVTLLVQNRAIVGYGYYAPV
eukprot:12924812-Ditylum_brightwellii.AAC.1